MDLGQILAPEFLILVQAELLAAVCVCVCCDHDNYKLSYLQKSSRSVGKQYIVRLSGTETSRTESVTLRGCC